MDILKVDPQAFQKNQKSYIFRDIKKSFQEVIPIGPEPHQFFSFQNISTNTVARGVQNLGKIGCGGQADWAKVKIFVSV